MSSWEAAALLVPPSRHSWLRGYLLLLYLLLRRGYDARIWRICDAAAALLFAADGVVVVLLLRCCLLLMLWVLMLLLLLRPRGRTGARPMRASSPSVGANSIIASRRNVLLGCTECAVRALSEKVRGGCVHSL